VAVVGLALTGGPDRLSGLTEEFQATEVRVGAMANNALPNPLPIRPPRLGGWVTEQRANKEFFLLRGLAPNLSGVLEEHALAGRVGAPDPWTRNRTLNSPQETPQEAGCLWRIDTFIATLTQTPPRWRRIWLCSAMPEEGLEPPTRGL
jgi:hypothetical protein